MRRALLALAIASLHLALLAPSATAAFGIEEVEVDSVDPLGAPSLQAGSHPFGFKVRLQMESVPMPGGKKLPDGAVKNLTVSLPPGFAADPLAVQPCSLADFFTIVDTVTSCPNATAVGVQSVQADFDPLPVGEETYLHVPIFNLVPPPGIAARFGFVVLGIPVTVDGAISPDPPYNAEARVTKITQAAHFYGSLTTLWSDPGSPAHDSLRGACLDVEKPADIDEPPSLGECPLAPGARRAFLTLPRSCTGPLLTHFEALSWAPWLPGEGGLIPGPSETATATALTEPGMVNCPKLGFDPSISAQPSTDHAESPSGLAFDLHVDDSGLSNPVEEATAESDLKKAVVTLPEGVTVNPSQAEGLAVCSEAQLAAETATSEFGQGCPPASRIGSIEVETPLLEGEVLKGSLFIATPHENLAGDSLIAFYIVIKSPERGIAVKQAARVEPDPRTGQLITITDDIPQLPFSEFRLRFREGGRSPLITPPACGTYETKAVLTPWANPANLFVTTSSFQITRGVGGGPCPPAGPPPFAPGLSAGMLNNNAASYSPFVMRLTRRDGDQDLTRFDATLPPGLVAKLAGVAKCPDSAIAEIKAKTGRQELTLPSCPADSQIGTAVGGAGVGSQLTYARGAVYLAGPFAGAPLSVLGVVPAVAGPFDVGVITTRQALTLDPVTGQGMIDGARSEPIPHILAGIPLKVRYIQVNIDRPEFTLNPTSCREMAVQAQIWGGGADPFSSLDDAPVAASDRFQAANCSLLGFKPRLSFALKGGTERGGHPSFKGLLRTRPGDANLRKTVVRFPRSTFLDQAHIRTVCTRVQFRADRCPSGSIYGHVEAITPLLEEPLKGPVYLRSSDNLLPDIVFDLKGLLDIEVSARADSVNGKLRVSFTSIPDAPASKVIVRMAGAKKGLLVNSRNICDPKPKARVVLEGQNEKRRTLRPVMRAQGCS